MKRNSDLLETSNISGIFLIKIYLPSSTNGIRRIFLICFLLVLSAAILSSCKKGEGDPGTVPEGPQGKAIGNMAPQLRTGAYEL